MASVLPRALIVALFSTMVSAFGFSATSPTQCDNLNITWTGGQAPFQLLLTPAFGTPLNFSIPDSAFNNNKGSWSTQLNVAAGKKFLLMMSDSTGIGSGGTSQLYTVGSSVSGASCNTTDRGVDFTFEANSALQQCRPYPFTNYDAAVQPITILGLIPDGNATILRPPNGATFDWNVNAAAGTNLMFVMFDSQGRQGGASDVLTVGATDDNTCLNNLSPSTTATPTATSTSGPTSTSTGTKTSIGAIAGTAAGALLALAILVTLGLFFLKKYRDDRRSPYGGGGGLAHSRRRSQRIGSVDYTLDQPSARPFGQDPNFNGYNFPSTPYSANAPPETPAVFMPASGQYESHPFTLPATSPNHTRTSSKVDPNTPHNTDLSHAGRSKAALAGETAYRPTRYIVHNDLEEAGPSEQEEELVELPPQYTDRRDPSAAESASNSSLNRQPSQHLNLGSANWI